MDALTVKAKEFSRQAYELNAKAQAIEDASLDLKAVNPHGKSQEDTRTPEELLAFIADKGREVA